jgi:hypothetical protein
LQLLSREVTYAYEESEVFNGLTRELKAVPVKIVSGDLGICLIASFQQLLPIFSYFNHLNDYILFYETSFPRIKKAIIPLLKNSISNPVFINELITSSLSQVSDYSHLSYSAFCDSCHCLQNKMSSKAQRIVKNKYGVKTRGGKLGSFPRSKGSHHSPDKYKESVHTKSLQQVKASKRDKAKIPMRCKNKIGSEDISLSFDDNKYFN